jgi:signal transduction histidine kinase
VGHLQLIDLEASRALPGEAAGAEDPLLILTSTAVIHPEPLPAEIKASLYQQGFSYVSEGADDVPALRLRLQAMLQVRSRLLTEQAVSRRLKQWLESQQTQIAHQTDFLHMAVHDLRGPLAAMICYAELLMEGVLGNLQASQLEPIRTIHRNCQFLIDMVNDLLDSARIETGKLALKLEKTNFTRELENAVQSLRSLAETKRIELRTEAEEIPEMYLDVQKVGRILTNLLGNAIKFTRSGGEIVLRVGRSGNTLVFSIQDMGPGISEADRQAIFRKFHTGSGSNIAGKGHGLGLAICKSFVGLHGGKIYVESTRHKGSVFIVHLPLEKRRTAAKASAEGGRRVLALDLGEDIPGLEALSGLNAAGLVCKYLRGGSWDWNGKHPAFDVLLVNESGRDAHDFGGDFMLLRLGELRGKAPCALVVAQDMPEAEKELRRHLGFRLLEKPCTPQALFDKLQGIVGSDRRQRGG